MDILIVPILGVIYSVLSIVYWIILANIIVSWLIMFGILNIHNSFVYSTVSFLTRFTDIFANRIRSIVSPIAGIDFSLIIILFAIHFLQSIIARLLLRYALLG